jgi:cytochrome P450
MTEPPAERFPMLDPRTLADPFPLYRRMREEAPVYWSGQLRAWVLTRYRDAVAVLRDAQTFSSQIAFSRTASEEQQRALEPTRYWFGQWFLFKDPPDHARMRGLVQKTFTPRVVESMRPRVEALVEQLLDQAAARGQLDLIADLGAPLPVAVITAMLGADPRDSGRLRAWSDDLALVGAADYDSQLRIQRGLLGLTDYFRPLLESPPPGSLLAALAAARDETGVLSPDEVLSTAALLMFAGHETTTNLLGNAVLTLLQRPEQWELLRANPGLVEGAVEETLRFCGPSKGMLRRATRDCTVGGTEVRAGQNVLAAFGAANRDPEQFSDPERFDITRADSRHIAFGYGAHFCLGAALARMEAQVALAALARRLVRPRLLDEQPAWRMHVIVHGLRRLPIGFERLG